MTEIQLSKKEQKKVREEIKLINKLWGVYDVDELIKESLERIENILKGKKNG